MLFESVNRLEAAIRARRDTDTRFMNWWLYVFLVNPVTFWIYGIVLYFRRMKRVTLFVERKRLYHSALLDFTEQHARQVSRYDAQTQGALEDLRLRCDTEFARRARTIPAGLFLLLTFLTLGLWGAYSWYRINRAWNDIQYVEEDFHAALSPIWQTLGLTTYPVSFHPDPTKRRSYWLYVFLGVITLTIWFLIWDFKVHNDADKIYDESAIVEDTVMQIVRQHPAHAGQQAAPSPAMAPVPAAPALSAPAASASGPPPAMFCPSCGARQEATARFCGSCGNQLPARLDPA